MVTGFVLVNKSLNTPVKYVGLFMLNSVYNMLI